ncbi:MAG: TldD/PmbA family protein [Nitrospirae bacterium]|nr:TldD/PmbA family protein [Nitrospirota bacterium]
MNSAFAEDVIKKALQRGCDAAEVFIKNSKGISIEAKDGDVEALEASLDFGMALRVIKKRKLGFAFTTSPEYLEATMEEAVQGAEWTGMDECVDVPDYISSSGPVLIYDEKIKNVKEGDVIKDALLLEESALAFDDRIKKVRKAAVEARTESTAVMNSKGVNVAYEGTYYSANVTTLAREGDDSQMGWDFAAVRRMSDMDLVSVGRAASKRALELLGSRRISAVKAPVILSPDIAVSFLRILSASLSAEAVQKKRSFLADKVGGSVTSRLIDIIDDGTMEWGAGTMPVDDEGSPVSFNKIISKGILNGYLHNAYTAKKSGVKSTGNAVRGSFKSLPGINVTNFYIKAAEERESGVRSQKSEEKKNKDSKLIRSLSRGILILSAMGVHTANPISGDFSVGISGLWIENGEPLYPVKEAVISGNILEMFKKVEGVGEDLKFYGNIGSPSLLIGYMDISA